jgi:hypothetical protein
MLHHLHDDGEEEAAPVTVCVVAKVRPRHEPSEARRGAHSHSGPFGARGTRFRANGGRSTYDQNSSK